MFRSKTSKLTVGGVLLSSVLLFGFDGTRHRISAAIDEAREFFNDHTSLDQLIRVGKKQLAEAEERLLDAEASVKDRVQQLESVKGEIARLQKASAVGRERLEALRPALSGNEGFQHASCQFSAADVRQDAIQLASFVKQCDVQMGLRQQQFKELGQVLSTGDATLAEARAEFTKAQTRFQELEIRLTQQQAIAQASAAARATQQDLSGELGGDFASTLGSLEKRLTRLQRQNDSVRSSEGSVPVGNIPFDSATGSNALSLVNEVLGTPAAATKNNE